MALLFAIIFAFLALLSFSLLKTIRFLPARELKIRARSGDAHAAALWRARAYDGSLAVVLWVIGGLLSALFFWQLTQTAPWWLAMLGGALFLWLGFAWLPTRKVSKTALSIGTFLAPTLSRVLEQVHGPLDRVARLVDRRWAASAHTGLYDEDDLLDLIQDQYNQPDSRIDKASLTRAAQALTFTHRLVGEIMMPRRNVKAVSVDDTIGPVLMTELHASGQAFFPVYQDKQDHIVGSLALHDLVEAKATGPVRDRMHTEAYVLHEDQPLSETLETILQPNRHLFMVLDDREEYIGVVTTEDILRQIIGQPVAQEPEPEEPIEEIPAPEETEPPTEPSTEVVE